MAMKHPPQPMLPRGFMGRVFGWLMERLAAGNYRWAIAQLQPVQPRSYLEIGFGTGRLAEMVVRTFKPVRLAGVDPSDLMLATALKRLQRFASGTRIEIGPGDANALPDGPFDAIVASHTFQFWSDPVATLSRIHDLLGPNGRLVFVIRSDKSRQAMDWLPNPISRSGDELGGLRNALAAAGFRLLADENLPSGSQGMVAATAQAV